jgi:hypothetical protein
MLRGLRRFIAAYEHSRSPNETPWLAILRHRNHDALLQIRYSLQIDIRYPASPGSLEDRVDDKKRTV